MAALALAALLALGVLFSAVSGRAEEETPRDRYTLDIEVLFAEQAVRVEATVEYTNRTGLPLQSMIFNVYANAMRRQATVPVESDSFSDAYPSGYAPGGVDFICVQVNGEDADWGVQGDAETFLRVQCDLQPGEQAEFTFEYYLLLPEYSGTMGVGRQTWRLTNFYPVAAVWDPYLHEFPLNGYTEMGEPLHSEAADYEISIALPEAYGLAAPGEISEEADGAGNVRYAIRAEGIREAALMISRNQTEKTALTDAGTEIRVLANGANAAKKLLNAALPAVNWLEEMFGALPWPAVTIVQTESLYGTAYPGVIQVNDAEEDEIVLLCIQQVFSGVVGSNPSGAPWLSDALSSFVRLMYYEEKNGYEDYLVRLNEQVLPSLQVTIPGGVTVDSEAGRFVSRMEYEIVVVDRGCAVLHEMRQTMGEETFLRALQEYVTQNRLGNTTATEFLQAVNDVSGKRWNEYLYGQMHNIDDYVEIDLTWFE